MAFLDSTGLTHLWAIIVSKLIGKVDKVDGKGLSTNDYTTAEKNKLAGIAEGAQVNTVTGIKGDAESSYRTGNVNITPANIGAATSSHTHNIENLNNFDSRVYDATIKRPANYILASPNGSEGPANFRKLVESDLPSHTHSNYLPISGGTMTGPINIAQQDDLGINLGDNGRINSNGLTTLGTLNKSTLFVGSPALNMRFRAETVKLEGGIYGTSLPTAEIAGRIFFKKV